ncbi:MAG TPA: GTPase domain-containing protein [Thermoanaerobaculia bacterium]|nr:GTPase domain-containing protein [Thermoanaerobaculia bacterium]
MALFNHATKELTAKIVYYGPGLCGKTSNLKMLHQRLERGAGKLLSLSTAQDRTIYFDLLPIELGNIKGYTVRFQVCTVPGQVFYNETRKIVLRGVDGLVFVVDSQWSMLSHNLECFQNLKENLHEEKILLETLPVVIQYNKRDLPSALSVEALQDSLGFHSYPFVETVASEGTGVIETFKLVSKLTFVDLLRRLQRGWQPPPEVPADLGTPAAIVTGAPPAPPLEVAAPAPPAAPEEAPVLAAASSATEPESREELRDGEAEVWVVPSAEGAFPDLTDDSAGSSTEPAVEPLPPAEPTTPAPRDEPEPATLAPAVLLAALTTPPPPPPAPPPPAPVPAASSPGMTAFGRSSSVDEKLNAVLAEARKSAGKVSGAYRRLEAHEGSTQEIPARDLTERRLEELIAGLRAEMSAEIARLREELSAARAAATSAETAASEAAERARRLENALREALRGLTG